MSAPGWPDADLVAAAVDAVRRLFNQPGMSQRDALEAALRLALAVDAGQLRIVDAAEYRELLAESAAVATVAEAAKRGEPFGPGFDA